MTADQTDVRPALAWLERELGAVVTATRALVGGSTGVMLAVTLDRGDEVVLRLITEEPWRTHGEGLATRESQIQEMLGGALPAPRSLALDAGGRSCGHPAHVMTLLPGQVDQVRHDPDSLHTLAELLAAVHRVSPTIEVRDYQSWAWEEKFVVPHWAERPQVWSAAFEVLREPSPAFEPVFLHRDFALRNVLWDGARITGLVDWVEASIGPAWLDVAHASTNLALDVGEDAAYAFATAYAVTTGRAPAAYWDVMDVVGFLPPPGRTTAFDRDPDGEPRRRALERHLVAVSGRL